MLKELQFSVKHCDSVFTFTSHGFTQLHLDSCTMCVVMAGVFSLMWVLLFHGPCTVYSSLYGHCDCFQLLLGQKKLQNDILVHGILIQVQGSSWKFIKEENGSEPRPKLLPSAQCKVQLFSIFSNPVLLGLNLNWFVLCKPTGLSPPSQSLMTPFGVLWVIPSTFL